MRDFYMFWAGAHASNAFMGFVMGIFAGSALCLVLGGLAGFMAHANYKLAQQQGEK